MFFLHSVTTLEESYPRLKYLAKGFSATVLSTHAQPLSYNWANAETVAPLRLDLEKTARLTVTVNKEHTILFSKFLCYYLKILKIQN